MIKNCSKNDSRQQKSLVHDTHSTENCVACDSALLKEIMELIVAEMKNMSRQRLRVNSVLVFILVTQNFKYLSEYDNLLALSA